MTSVGRIDANRKNAARSRGPQTDVGKARASRNALRHGLAVNVLEDPATRAEAEKLAAIIAGANAGGARLAQARVVAETQLDLLRIREAQLRLMHTSFITLPPAPGMGGHKPLISQADDVNSQDLEPAPEALIRDVLPQLVRLDRYERRALSRRRRAMRAFHIEGDR